MSNEVFNSFEIVEIFLENDLQKVFLCKHKENGMPFLVNALLDTEISELLDFEELNKDNNIFIKIFKSEKMIYIVTKYLNYKSLKEYISNNKISLSTQIKYTSFLMDNLKEISNYPSFIINSVLNHNNILVDDNQELKCFGLLVLDSNYKSIEKSKILKTIANSLSIIYTGTELNEEKINNDIPPDIKKIIIKCLNNDYGEYNEIISDFRECKLYALINPETKEANKVHSIRKKLNKNKRMFKFKKASIYGLIILLLMSPILGKGINKLYNTLKDIIVNSLDEENLNDENNINDENNVDDEDNEFKEIELSEDDNEKDKNVDDESTEEDEISRYFNEEYIDYTSDNYIAKIDEEVSYKGNQSILVDSTDSTKKEYLVGFIDMENGVFNHFKDKSLDISLWLKADVGQNSKVILKVFKGEELVKSSDKKVYILKDSWSLHNLSIKANDGEVIKIYLEVNEKSKIWIDNIEIGILK